MKRILIIVVVLVLILGLSSSLWIDHAAKAAMEAGGAAALGVRTSVGSVHLGVFRGRCSLKAVRLDNPPGYKTPYFLDLGKGSVEVSLKSVMGDQVEIPSLTLDDVTVNLDRSGGDANYDVILENLKKLEGEPKPEAGKKKRFVIREVVIRNIRVNAQLSIAGVLKPTVPLLIDEMRLTDVGEEGVPLSRVFDKIIGGLLRGIAEAGVGILPDEITGGLKKGLGALGSVGKTGLKIVGEGGKKITEGIGKLFGK